MKKLLLGSVAVIGLAAVVTPAQAGNGLSLDVGGHFKGYATWHDQDSNADIDVPVDGAVEDARGFDMLRETEVHFSGETTLDNGLTVGVHIEADVDDGDSFTVDESYAYFSGAWGRINFGEEDGAAYLLQVAAPSADSNVDGIRQFINPVIYALNTNFSTLASNWNIDGLDYDNDLTGEADKITYLTPVLNGFQAGLSYTPDVGGLAGQTAVGGSNSIGGVNPDDVTSSHGAGVELGARYEGQFDEIGFSVGGGYTHVEDEESATPAVTDDFTEWNVGLDMDWGAFGLGLIYTENNNGVPGASGDDNETWVVGIDYSFGAFKLGASWLNNDNDVQTVVGGGNAGTVETDRWTGGIVYTYGPGMTFRGALSYVDHDVTGGTDMEATSLIAGTQIRF